MKYSRAISAELRRSNKGKILTAVHDVVKTPTTQATATVDFFNNSNLEPRILTGWCGQMEVS